eukprot:TRINITY_DN6887_c0_g1_i3.p1 TRINITY_DN6887_c0_g1~~TRINITY_DN6887_c0_g1_i3.p1  ORF type:complete len:509 (+),score=28.13 TRINITY_DN6887_c0_g1_i3:116-1642(+)
MCFLQELQERIVYKVFSRALEKREWPRLDRLKVRQLNKSYKEVLDRHITRAVLTETTLWQHFNNLDTVIIPHPLSFNESDLVPALSLIPNLKEIIFREMFEYVSFTHTLMLNYSIKQSLGHLRIKMSIHRRGFIRPCLELAKLADLDVRLYCNEQSEALGFQSNSWVVEDVADEMADETDARLQVFRGMDVSNEFLKNINNEYFLQQSDSFLSLHVKTIVTLPNILQLLNRLLVDNNTLELLVFHQIGQARLSAEVVEVLRKARNLKLVDNNTLELLVFHQIGQARLSAEVVEVLRKARNLKLVLATLSNQQLVDELPNVTALELQSLVYEQKLPKMQNLKSITIRNLFKSKFGYEPDLKFVNSLTQLTQVHVGTHGDASFNEIVDSLSSLKKLKSLSLDFRGLQVDSFDGLLNFQDLEVLFMSKVCCHSNTSFKAFSHLNYLLRVELVIGGKLKRGESSRLKQNQSDCIEQKELTAMDVSSRLSMRLSKVAVKVAGRYREFSNNTRV